MAGIFVEGVYTLSSSEPHGAPAANPKKEAGELHAIANAQYRPCEARLGNVAWGSVCLVCCYSRAKNI